MDVDGLTMTTLSGGRERRRGETDADGIAAGPRGARRLLPLGTC